MSALGALPLPLRDDAAAATAPAGAAATRLRRSRDDAGRGEPAARRPKLDGPEEPGRPEEAAPAWAVPPPRWWSSEPSPAPKPPPAPEPPPEPKLEPPLPAEPAHRAGASRTTTTRSPEGWNVVEFTDDGVPASPR